MSPAPTAPTVKYAALPLPAEFVIRSVAVLLVVFSALLGWAAPSGIATALQRAPVLDGDVLGDEAWRGGRAMTGFTQVRPAEGEPASERTEVFVGYTETMLYVGVVCHDREPGAIIVSDTRRDSDLLDADSFRLVLDTFLDRQTGFVFGTSPSGVQYDGQIDYESTGGFFMAPGFNRNWDAAWEVRARISEIGWSAEMAIPFASLRYGPEQVQTWGVNFERTIRRRNEVAFWAPLPRQFGLERVSLAGTLPNVAAPARRSFVVTPYAVGRQAGGADERELGVDAKYSLTRSLTLDLTYNTDFAQVEADDQQVNLDRFSLFFPEKRPFFLENSGLFTVGAPSEIELFFSRRIGIGSGGQRLPIDGGARLSGKVGATTQVGLLHMRSRAVAEVAPENAFSVMRVKRQFGARSSAGVLAVGRDGGGGSNRTYAMDGRLGLGANGLVEGFVAQTRTENGEGDEHAWRLRGSYDSQTWSFNGGVTEVGDGFNPEVGFLARRDYRKVDVYAGRRYRPESLWGLLELLPHASYRGFWNSDGYYETGYLHLDNAWQWKSGLFAFTAVNFTEEGVREPFDISPGVAVPAARYKHRELAIGINTDSSRAVYGGGNVRVGGTFGGEQVAAMGFVRYRAGDAFGASLNFYNADVRLPGGDFVARLTRLRLNYSFSPKISLQGLVQHNAQDDVLSANLRFAWLQSANAGLFLVYNEVDDDRPLARLQPRREWILKYSRIFNVL